MEDEPHPERPHFILSPRVIEIHLQHGIGIQPGLAKLIWILNQLSFDDQEPKE